MRFLKQKTLSKFSPSDNALLTNDYGRAVMDLTGGLRLPKGTTAQRPQTSGVRNPNGANGYIRYNTTTDSIEGYVDSRWEVIRGPGDTAIQISRLVANGTETTFGPLNADYVGAYSTSDHNVMVLIDNVWQVGSNGGSNNFTVVRRTGGVFVAVNGGSAFSASGPGSYTEGEYYIQFPSAVPQYNGIGSPIYVTVYYGYGN